MGFCISGAEDIPDLDPANEEGIAMRDGDSAMDGLCRIMMTVGFSWPARRGFSTAAANPVFAYVGKTAKERCASRHGRIDAA